MSEHLHFRASYALPQETKSATKLAASMEQVRNRLYAGTLAVDVLSIVSAFAIASVIRFGTADSFIWAGLALAIAAIFVVIAALNGSYSLEVLRRPTLGIARAGSSLILAFLLFLLITFLLKEEADFSRAFTMGALGIAIISMTLTRLFGGDWICRHFQGRFTHDVILCDGVESKFSSGFHIITADSAGIRPDPRDAAMLLMLANLTQGVDRFVVSCRPEAAEQWARMLKGASVQGEILTNEYDTLEPTGVARVDGRASLVVSGAILSLRQRIAKRLFDLTFATAALIVTAPIFAVVAVAIKLDSPGPVFFRQMRVGRGNQMFRIFKFRTMRTERTDEHGAVSMRRDDDRTTRVGKFLRKTSLDELPQILNVLQNTMSLIGPRPHALGSLAGDQLFWHVDERYWHRHALKPGLTGLAQSRGYRGSTDQGEDLTNRLHADLEYFQDWTLWRDISILLRTVKVMVHPNAY
jgi:lipopolysaccharide/colanic/teichoic acid biosynthesis glycosyltransferase